MIQLTPIFSTQRNSSLLTQFTRSTLRLFCRRVLKNRIVELPKPQPALGHPLNKNEQKEKRTLNQTKGAIGKNKILRVHAILLYIGDFFLLDIGNGIC